MKNTLSALVAVALLSGQAYAADQATNEAAKAQADQQRIEDTHKASPAKKQAKKGAKKAAKKNPSNTTKPEPPAQSDEPAK